MVTAKPLRRTARTLGIPRVLGCPLTLDAYLVRSLKNLKISGMAWVITVP